MTERAPLVYVVDDDPSVLRGLSRLLRAWSYRVQAFSSAREFLAHEHEPGACLLVDLHMPGFSGIELQTELNLTQTRLPVVFVTGHGDANVRAQLMAAGAIECLQKPSADIELIEGVARAIACGSAHGRDRPGALHREGVETANLTRPAAR